MKAIVCALPLFFMVGCTTAQQINRPDGTAEFLVACGAGTGWNICYKRANEICPAGYVTLSETAGFNRKELRFSCPSKLES